MKTFWSLISNLLNWKEKSNILNGLKEKDKLVTELFNKIEGISCNPVLGAMYCFPKINLPNKAIEHAKVPINKNKIIIL